MFENAESLAQVIDHSLLRADATLSDLAAACEAAKQHRFAALVVNGCNVARARAALGGTGVKIGAVVGFPYGAVTTTVKILEGMEAMKNGAEELDIMINLGLAKSGRIDLVEIDLKNVITMTKGLVHKAIIEISALTRDEVQALCQMVVRCGAEFVKTGTGYGSRGATVEDIRMLREQVGSTCRVKAAGGICDLATVEAMVSAGAERIGTSAGPTIMEEFIKRRGEGVSPNR